MKNTGGGPNMRWVRFKVKWGEFKKVLAAEYRHILKDGGAMLILIFAIIIYATLYSFAYGPEVLREIPVGVIDNSKTPASRQLIRTFDAAPNVKVTYNPASMEEAKELFFSRKIYGVVYIPEDYERDLLGGVPTTVGVYVDASYFLMYRQVFSDVVAGVAGTGGEVGFVRLLSKGISAPQAQVIVQPLTYTQKNLYNPYLGYGTFLMPAILMVIVQQTLLIGIGMVGGTWRERGLYKTLITPGEKRLSTVPIVLGKTVAYMSIYAVTMFYIFGAHYKLFGYPMHAPFLRLIQFFVPYVLSCIFLGIAVSTLFRYRENSIIFLLWTSIPLLLVSGVSLPRQAIPEGLYYLGKIFPSSSGVEGFLRLQSMGATLYDVKPELTVLWILTIIYFVLACVGIRILLSKKEVIEGN